MSDRASVGSRVMIDDQRGTVKYIGAIPGTTGQWLGVDWDDPSRGKHDGSHLGTRYFNAQHPTSGSFVRAKRANFGLGFMAAVRDRYCSDEYAGDNVVMYENMKFELFFNKVSQQQRSLDSLLELDLFSTGCYGLAKDDDISGVFPQVRYLSLRACLVSSWSDVAQICEHLPRLNTLVVSETALSGSETFSDECRRGFTSVAEIIINSMKYSWSDVTHVMTIFPNLSVLRACYNSYPTIDYAKSLDSLRFLEIQFCDIASWDGIAKLGELPHLEYLNVSNNKITDIDIDPALFKSLSGLSLSSNLISTFKPINELNKLASLEMLTIKHNRLEIIDGFESWENCVARIKKLTKVDGITVDNITRQSCELDYLKYYGIEFVRGGGNQDLINAGKFPDTFTAEQPRYVELIEKYGTPFVGDGSGSTMKQNIVKVTIRCVSESYSKADIIKKLPLSMSVQKLKVLIGRAHKITESISSISYATEKVPNNEIELSHDLKELSFYSIENGDTILVRY